MPEWIGKTIGKVRIDKFLAHGGMAEVYLGSHLTLERPVAIKVLHSYIEENPDLLARFQREAKVVAGLRHPNIVQIYDFDTMDGHPYIVMEYLKGPTLATYLRGLHERNERIPYHQVARLLKGLASALDYAHGGGVIHRDVKPGNILLNGKTDEVPLDQPLSTDVEAILTDFGLVRIAHATHQTASGTVSGTPAYMSPEQARGDKTDHRTDIYSLGTVLYEMLAGRVPFEGDSTLSVIYKQINEPPPPIPGISAKTQAVMNRALTKNPDNRYQSCREMAIDFFLAIGMNAEAETIQATLSETPKTAAPPVTRKPARGLAWIGAGILSLLCLVGLGFGALKLSASIFPKGTSVPAAATNAEITSPTATAPPVEVTVLPSGERMVKISSGTYEVGLATANDFHGTAQSISLNDYWVDAYQVTNAQYRQYLDNTGAQPPLTWPVTEKENHPVRGVTWEQANAYCAWVNKRLPMEAEWEAAGRGTGSPPQLFPWGNDATAEGKALKLPNDDTYEVGSEAFNVSPFGLYDLVGNVWEWVGEPYAGVQEGFRILRGGRFGNAQDLAYRLAVPPNDETYTVYAGFRCAADQVR